jgi:hypothetical protein
MGSKENSSGDVLNFDLFLNTSIFDEPYFSDAELMALFQSLEHKQDEHHYSPASDAERLTLGPRDAERAGARTRDEPNETMSSPQNGTRANVQTACDSAGRCSVPFGAAPYSEHIGSLPDNDSQSFPISLPSISSAQRLPDAFPGPLSQSQITSNIPNSHSIPQLNDRGSIRSWQSDDQHLLSNFTMWLSEVDIHGPSLYVSPNLPYKQRMQVHALANVNGLSHMSVRFGSSKRVLATPFRIQPHTGNGTRRGWKLGWDEHPLYVDPCSICLGVDLKSREIQQTPDFDIGSFIRHASPGGLQPVAVPQELENSQQLRGDKTFIVRYCSAEDALRAFVAFDGRSSSDFDVRVDYAVMRDSFCIGTTRATPKLLLAFARATPKLLLVSDVNVSPPRPKDHNKVSSPSESSVTSSFQRLIDAHALDEGISRTEEQSATLQPRVSKVLVPLSSGELSPPGVTEYDPQKLSPRSASAPPGRATEVSRPASRATMMHSERVPHSRQRSVSRFSSDGDSHYSVASSASKRQKRSAKVESGYQCGECGKLFDLQSERDKHWRNVHGPRNHACKVCGKAFVYAKDVERHMSVHAKQSHTHPSNSLSGGETESVVSQSRKSRWKINLDPVRAKLSRKRPY